MDRLESVEDTFWADWQAFKNDFETVEKEHEAYQKQLQRAHGLQRAAVANLKRASAQLSALKDSLRRHRAACGADGIDGEQARMAVALNELADVKARMSDMRDELPREHNGLYLSVILGGALDVSLTNKADRYRYKDDYEKFKINVTAVMLVFSVAAYISQLRVMDAIVHFLLVWYYCTLTIREAILRINGSKIKGWWLAHHYISALLCGVLVTWPDGECYGAFRGQFTVFSMYTAVLQLMQCQYQRGCLRRLRALGERHSMDITVDGFHSWMFRGLTFLLPFLILGYVFELYNAYALVKIWYKYDCTDWQCLALAAGFLVVSVGNSVTTWQVIWRKLSESRQAGVRRRLQTKYSIVTATGRSPLAEQQDNHSRPSAASHQKND